MADMPYASTADLGAWVGETIADLDPRAQAVVMAASTLVRSTVGAAVADAWTTVPGEVRQVTVQVASRVWFNPQGVVADSVDDFSRRWDTGGESGVYLTDAEKDMLSPFQARPKGLWTLGTTRGGDDLDQYLAVRNPDGSTQSEPMPFLSAGE